jgi:hypothetical protein
MINNIKDLWDNHCSRSVKKTITKAIAEHSGLASNVPEAAKQRYFYDLKYKEGEAEVILGIIQNAIREENKKIANLKL